MLPHSSFIPAISILFYQLLFKIQSKYYLLNPTLPDKIRLMNKDSQNPLVGKFSLLSFFFEARDEIKKVTWPTRQQVIRMTLIVIIASVTVSIYLGALDYLFVNLVGFLINQ